jgi:hypothetical protein
LACDSPHHLALSSSLKGDQNDQPDDLSPHLLTDRRILAPRDAVEFQEAGRRPQFCASDGRSLSNRDGLDGLLSLECSSLDA